MVFTVAADRGTAVDRGRKTLRMELTEETENVRDALELVARRMHAIEHILENLMSAISDFADKVDANFATIQTGIAALDAEIQAFQPTISATDQARLDSIVAKSTALAAAATAPVTPTPVA